MIKTNYLLSPEKIKLYNDINKFHAAGYSQRKIERELHCSRNTIKKYLNSDMDSVCSIQLRSCVNEFQDEVISCLSEGMCRSKLYKKLRNMGLICGKTAAYDYFNQIAKIYNIELTPLEDCSPEQKQIRKNIGKSIHLSRKMIFDYLWMDIKPDIKPEQFEYLIEQYPIIIKLKVCILEFRQIFEKKSLPFLYCFIEKYKLSGIKLLSDFVIGIGKDLEAIENAVSSTLSNGFVEGTNNKVKMIKRTMYGRCRCTLLAAKLMLKV